MATEDESGLNLVDKIEAFLKLYGVIFSMVLL